MIANELAYRQLPRAIRHWLTEPEIAPQRHIWEPAFTKIDVEADGNPVACDIMRAIEWILSRRGRTPREKLDALIKLGPVIGRRDIDLKEFTGW
jgi:hypothetical protein